MIRVLIAEDQAMVRGALASLLALEEDIEVVAEAGRGDTALEQARALRPDVALLDIEMPGLDGLSAAAALARELPALRTLILTTFGRPGYLRRALENGARGFLLKDAPARELAAAIPSSPGISMSISATSGRVARAAATRRSPRSTSATTSMSSSSPSRLASAPRTIAWSSAIRTRITAPPGGR